MSPRLARPESPEPKLSVSFPPQDAASQDHEVFEVEIDGARRTLRCHDYAEIFDVPGLYELVFQEHLQCRSPQVVCSLFAEALSESGRDAASLRVLDLGAGNGLVGEQLRASGVKALVGVDLLPEAAAAAARDRPGVYDDYVVCDLTSPSDEEQARLTGHPFDALVTVAALGFDDLPAQAFVAAYNLVEDGGWTAFNLKEDFLAEDDPSGFGRLLDRMAGEGVIETRARHRYLHRLSVTGEPLHYVGLIATKNADVPSAWIEELGDLAVSG